MKPFAEIDYNKVLQEAYEHWPMRYNQRRSDHGPYHWLQVHRNAVYLASKTPGANLAVCRLFALVHDCKRQNEYKDIQHGPRAAVFVACHCERWGLNRHDVMIDLLVEACAYHDKGLTSTNPTIGVCWDADRLDLWRVGIEPKIGLMSTAAGREELSSKFFPLNQIRANGMPSLG